MIDCLQVRNLILASASPRRSELLDQVGIPYIVQPSSVEENMEGIEGTPAEIAEKLAYKKARDVASKVESGLVLGADTIVVIDNVILGKPKDKNDAQTMLVKLSGKEHQVITGVALIDVDKNRKLISHEMTYVTFRSLTDEMINAYIATPEPMGKAGAYAIQGVGAIFIEGIRGCYSNVVGLPLVKLSKMLEKLI